MQRALAQVWRYFDPADYAHAVLRDAPLDNGRITVERVEHVPLLRELHHIRDARINLINQGLVDDLAFLRDAPPLTTVLQVEASQPVDLAPLSSCPALEIVDVLRGEVSSGWEVLSALPALSWLDINLPDGGRDLSFLARCPSLTAVVLYGCTELSDLSMLVSVSSRLRYVNLRDAKRIRDLSALTGLSDLTSLIIEGAPLVNGVAAVIPILDRLKEFGVWSVPTATSLQAVSGSSLQEINLADCPITDWASLATLQSLTKVWLRDFPTVDLAPLAALPHLRDLILMSIEEPVDLSPLARIDHRLRVKLNNTSTVGATGSLVKVQRL
ncbi:MAG: hypothetical protein M3308_02920 [Actinomycetota bacterium]|nr:hypothetical protein [Actinomycetota bacterium]